MFRVSRRTSPRSSAGCGTRRAHAAVCVKGGGLHQEPNPLFQVLPEAADGEWRDRKNRSGQSEIAQTGVQAGMNYCINRTVSISSDPFDPLAMTRRIFFLPVRDFFKNYIEKKMILVLLCVRKGILEA